MPTNNKSCFADVPGFMTIDHFSKQKKIPVKKVEENCREGKYLGAFFDIQGERWFIPVDYLKKSADSATSQVDDLVY